LVSYRDIGENGHLSVIPQNEEFVSVSANEFVTWRDELTKLPAQGGGDLPEDVQGSLNKALKLKWKVDSKVRFVVLIGDAPGHGYGGPQVTDCHPESYSVDSLVSQMKKNRIELLYCVLNPSATKLFQNKLEDCYKTKPITPEENELKMISVDLFTSSGNSTSSGYHFIFCLDESGSMNGGPWADLTKAYNSFINQRRENQSGNDFISVIQFDSSSDVIHQNVNIMNNVALGRFRGGGTMFHPPLKTAEQFIATYNMSTVIIFMSDGGCSDAQQAYETMAAIGINYRASRNLSVYTIAFGTGADVSILTNLANQSGCGKFINAIDGLALSNAFQVVSTDAKSTVDQLVTSFGQKISEQISYKMICDYF